MNDSETELQQIQDEKDSEVCAVCGKIRKEHLSGWGSVKRYCSFKPNIKFISRSEENEL